MIRKTPFVEGEYYHVYHRGNQKQIIFFDDDDRRRFLALLFLLQPLEEINSVGRTTKEFTKKFPTNHGVRQMGPELKYLIETIPRSRKVELVNFELMPNHFHLTLGSRIDGAISVYMQRILNSFTKYINTKYKRTGHLFQGPFGSKHVEDNDQLLYLSTYIHRNHYELKEWKNKFSEYPWSSYQDYALKNRWGNLLCTEVITEQFDSEKEYKDFCDDSVAKLQDEDEDFAWDNLD